MLTIRISGWLTGMTFLCLFVSTARSGAQQYSLKDLGTLPGDSVSKGLALNNGGQAAGDSSSPTAAIATLFSGGKATNIGTAGSSVSIATAINDPGEVAGWNSFNSSSTFNPQAFLFSNGSATNITSSSLFPSGAEPAGMNNAGEVVGTGYLTSANFHAFVYSAGKMTDLGPANAYQASAVAINNSGQIIGGYYLNSGTGGEFLFTAGKMTTLPVPAGANAVSAFAINDNGEIAGSIFFTSGAPAHAAKFANGVWTDLGAISGASSSRGTAINISGQIVGTAFFPQTQYHPPKPGKHVPFLVTSSGLVNLNSLIPSGTGFTLTDAVAINNAGQILCDANNSGGVEHAVLLTPQ
jgi:probable HAF family extracellular repeat protein